MKNRNKKLLIVGLSTSFILANICSAIAAPKSTLLDKYHFDATVVDTHIDTIMQAVDRTTSLPNGNIFTSYTTSVDTEKLEKGRIDVSYWGAYTGGTVNNGIVDVGYANNSLLASINALYYVTDNNKDIEIATSTKEIEKLVKAGKLVAVPQIEGAYSLNNENALELVRQYYDLGIRALSLTHSNSSLICEGFNQTFQDKTPSSGGLSDTGAAVIKEMNRLGMVVDVSHLSKDSIDEILQISEAPVIASHTGVQGKVNTGRNLTDDQLDALAKNGGVAQVTFYTAIISPGEISSKEVADTIDYIVDRIGVDHVGVGSDFDGAPMPTDLKTAADLPNLTQELINRGYSKSEVHKILGGNTLRVMKEVEQKSKNNNASPQLSIETSVKMSERVAADTKEISATIKNLKGSKFKAGTERVFIDGIEVDSKLDRKTNTVSVSLSENLASKFHVITFTAETTQGREYRETVLFYVNQ